MAPVIRKLLLTFVLPLLLLLGQHGQAWHELQHAASGRAGTVGGGATTDHRRQPADKVCQACLSFAHLGAAVAPSPPALDLLGLSHGWWLAQGGTGLDADAPSQRSRGPPAVL